MRAPSHKSFIPILRANGESILYDRKRAAVLITHGIVKNLFISHTLFFLNSLEQMVKFSIRKILNRHPDEFAVAVLLICDT